jgi:nickel transport protein
MTFYLNKFCFPLILVLVFALSLTVHAHKLKVFAAIEGDSIKGFIYFPGGGKPGELKLKVYQNDKFVTDIMSNKTGNFVYKPLKEGSYRFVADSGDGHLGDFTVTWEVGGSAKKVVSEKSVKPEATSHSGNINHDLLGEQIQKSVDKSLYPLKVKLDELENRIQFRDILGGIGFILGLFGIFAYFKSLTKKQNND